MKKNVLNFWSWNLFVVTKSSKIILQFNNTTPESFSSKFFFRLFNVENQCFHNSWSINQSTYYNIIIIVIHNNSSIHHFQFILFFLEKKILHFVHSYNISISIPLTHNQSRVFRIQSSELKFFFRNYNCDQSFHVIIIVFEILLCLPHFHHFPFASNLCPSIFIVTNYCNHHHLHHHHHRC